MSGEPLVATLLPAKIERTRRDGRNGKLITVSDAGYVVVTPQGETIAPPMRKAAAKAYCLEKGWGFRIQEDRAAVPRQEVPGVPMRRALRQDQKPAFSVAEFERVFAERTALAMRAHPWKYDLCPGEDFEAYAARAASVLVDLLRVSAKNGDVRLPVTQTPPLRTAMDRFGISSQKALLDAFRAVEP